MASSKCSKSEAIALLSMYLDNEEDDPPAKEEEEICVNKSKDDDPITIRKEVEQEVAENKSKDDLMVISGTTIRKMQKKIEKIISLKKRMNAELRQRKEFRNPYFLENVIKHYDYDRTGSNRCNYDQYDISDFYDDKSYKKVCAATSNDAAAVGYSAAVANQRMLSETEDERRTNTKRRRRI